MYFLLFYDYIEDILEKRAPFREGHLALVSSYQDQNMIVLAGVYVDPLDGALLIFRCDDKSEVERFTAQDPYVQNGLVSNWNIREWNVVAGTALNRENHE